MPGLVFSSVRLGIIRTTPGDACLSLLLRNVEESLCSFQVRIYQSGLSVTMISSSDNPVSRLTVRQMNQKIPSIMIIEGMAITG